MNIEIIKRLSSEYSPPTSIEEALSEIQAMAAMGKWHHKIMVGDASPIQATLVWELVDMKFNVIPETHCIMVSWPRNEYLT
jgi:hypothetical protein